jgi:phosphinothricin acetyltransferase
MADHFQIRDATLADIPAITAIYAHEVENGVASFEENAPSESEMAARFSKIVDAKLPYLVADRAGAVLGYAYAGPYHTRAAYRYTLEDTIYIHRNAQRQGAGRALLTELIPRCKVAGGRQLLAVISYTPNNASVALHAQFGFRTIGVAKAIGFKFGRWHDVAYMQRAIGPGDAMPPDDRPIVGQIAYV